MKPKKILKLITLFAVGFLVVPLILYFYQFNMGLATTDQAWANFGSYFGGVTAAVFSFASFVSVLYGLVRAEDVRTSENEEKHIFALIDLLGRHKSFMHCYVLQEDLHSSQVVERYNQAFYNFAIPTVDGINISFSPVPYFSLENSVSVYCNLIIYILEYIDTTSNKLKYTEIFLSQLSETDRQCVVSQNIDFFEKHPEIRRKLIVENKYVSIKNIKSKVDEVIKAWGGTYK
ncbi:hypothetical protein [Leptospira licerasiae]|uniref:Phage abortive infection protein n=1 Tax=Leptospira licerasiae str. MMD4847 TaxID=1049971 RepID=A0ABN0HEB9_9LEPT|nr:hypothetical protein [Leptospira licerasiae]EIE01007.1 hypothetical protein LEP1GSC185_3868 [Leptospira licerasiae serovar Varillal str. VAR 010]EJZ43896.1 hypothetical protein LEP1GSC178_2024 [Leptospira licerasiae str. MMD4847]